MSNCTNIHVIKSVSIADVFYSTIDSVKLLIWIFAQNNFIFFIFTLETSLFLYKLFLLFALSFCSPDICSFILISFGFFAGRSLSHHIEIFVHFHCRTKLKFIFFSFLQNYQASFDFPSKRMTQKHTPLFVSLLFFTLYLVIFTIRILFGFT